MRRRQRNVGWLIGTLAVVGWAAHCASGSETPPEDAQPDGPPDAGDDGRPESETDAVDVPPTRCERDDDCDDGLDCTTDTCDLATRTCRSAPDSGACDDGNPCNGEERCDVVLGCLDGTPVDCDDGVGCTVDDCNPMTLGCTHTPDHGGCVEPRLCDPERASDPSGCIEPPSCAEDAECDDGDACNGAERCGADLLCRPGVPVDCDDGRDCTEDRCNPSDGSCGNLSPDLDRDGYGDAACTGVDCDDGDPGVHPGAVEACNGRDDDCVGGADDGAVCPAVPHALSSACRAGSCVPFCEAGWGDCNGVAADGCETALTSTVHCGGCGIPCDLPRAAETCASGICAVAGCDAGWGDCNGVSADGCEEPLSSTTHCGACGNPCAPANAVGPSCAGGACTHGGCLGGFGDCNGVPADGCEQPLNSTAHCGACRNLCDLAHAGESCAGGSCVLGACDPGWGNCDGLAATGCETALNSTANCGGCGLVCVPANAVGASCASGSCGFTGCVGGWGNCDGASANGCEQSLSTLAHCGACGAGCSPANTYGASCAGGTCSFAGCNAGYGNCDGVTGNGCEASFTSPTSCGTGCAGRVDCTALPHVGSTGCSAGSCSIGACTSGWSECNDLVSDGCERSLDNNVGTCGANYLGSISGDSGSGTLSRTSYGEQWYYFELTEDEWTSSDYISATLTLDVPPGVDYDLFVRCGGSGCSSSGPSGRAGVGIDETVNIRWDDASFSWDDRNVYVEIRFYGGSTLDCGGWTLTIRGNTAVSSVTC